MSVVELPVSIGEALDKLTILEIKLENIKDEKKVESCKREREELFSKLKKYVDRFSFWYNVLKKVNAEIWRLQDVLRASNDIEGLAKHVLDLNDIRFRIKNKLNIYTKSYLKEQKGYAEKNLLLLQPISLKDAFRYKSILLYLSIEYDNVFLSISNSNLKELFQENIYILPANQLSEYRNNCKVYEKYLSETIIDELNLVKSILSSLIPKSGLFISHLGLGDMINMNGAVNFLAREYDEIFLVSYTHNYKNVRDLYSSNPKIKILTVDVESQMWENGIWTPQFLFIFPFFPSIWKSGIFLENHQPCIDLPKCFYRDIGLPVETWQKYSELPRLKESMELYKKLEGIPYIFLQQKASDKILDLIRWDKNAILTIDSNINVYEPSDRFYSIAESLRGKPLFHYLDILENAKEIHVIDSSFCTLLFLIPTIKASIKKIYDRETKMSVYEAELAKVCVSN